MAKKTKRTKNVKQCCQMAKKNESKKAVLPNDQIDRKNDVLPNGQKGMKIKKAVLPNDLEFFVVATSPLTATFRN